MSTKRALVIDDNPDHRAICIAILRHHEYEVLEAKDGQDGVRIAHEQRPDLILMDGMLPVLDGWAATERLKAAPETAEIPVIMLTARVLAEDQARSMDAGVDSYLPKPCEPQRIAEEVRRLIGSPSEPAAEPEG